MAKRTGLAGRLLLDQDGATMVEYALLIAFVAIVCVVAVTSLGNSLKLPFQHATTGLS